MCGIGALTSSHRLAISRNTDQHRKPVKSVIATMVLNHEKTSLRVFLYLVELTGVANITI